VGDHSSSSSSKNGIGSADLSMSSSVHCNFVDGERQHPTAAAVDSDMAATRQQCSNPAANQHQQHQQMPRASGCLASQQQVNSSCHSAMLQQAVTPVGAVGPAAAASVKMAKHHASP
jgi:hypothetical protein